MIQDGRHNRKADWQHQRIDAEKIVISRVKISNNIQSSVINNQIEMKIYTDPIKPIYYWQ